MDSAGNTHESTKEPTMLDLYNLMKECASKKDVDDIKKQIAAEHQETSSQIAEINKRVDNVASTNAQHSEIIEQLQASIESLKQDQLRNNICISGVPTDALESTNTAEIVIKIAKTLGVEITRQHFTSYPVANNKFIIVSMFNNRNKQLLINKIRVKRSLLVEEVFQTKSNSQIYLNDHLTIYFNRLYLLARQAKKEGKLASATSYGGKIRARKSLDDAPTIITTETQLKCLIDSDQSSTNHSAQCVDSSMEIIDNTPNKTAPNATSSAKKTEKKTRNNNKNNKNIQEKYPLGPPQRGRRTSSKHKNSDRFDTNRDISNKKQKLSNSPGNSNTAVAM